MNELLKINNQVVDIVPNSITRNIRVSDIGNLSSRKASLSVQFTLPRTLRNNLVTKGLLSTHTNSRFPYEKASVNYTVDNIVLIEDGILTVEGVDESGIKVRIKDGISDLSDRINGQDLADLPLDEYNHYLDTQVLYNSFSNTSGYIYGLADFGIDTDKTEYFMPSLYVHSIWAKIFEAAGVTYEGDFFTTDAGFLSEVLPPQKGFVANGTGESVTALASGSGTPLDRRFVWQSPVTDFQDVVLSGSAETGAVAGIKRITVTNSYTIDFGKVIVNVLVGGEKIATRTLEEGEDQTNEFVVNYKSSSNQPIEVKVIGIQSEENSSENFVLEYDMTTTYSVENVNDGQFVQISDIIGDVSQAAFIKDVVVRHGLYIFPKVGTTDTYVFKKINDVLNDRAGAEDWTDKYVSEEGFKSIPSLGQVNTMLYKYPENDNADRIDGEFTVTNENLVPEKVFYTSIFTAPAASPKNIDGQGLFLIPLMELEEGEIELKESPVKIMNVLKTTKTLNLSYLNDSAVPFTGSAAFLVTDGVDMQGHINDNYGAYKDMMDDYKELSIKVNLTNQDVSRLSLSSLKYLRQTGKFYFLDSLRHSAGKPATAKLIRINNFNTQ